MGKGFAPNNPGPWYYAAGLIILIVGSIHIVLLLPIELALLDIMGFSPDPIAGSVLIISSVLLLFGAYRTVSGLEDSKGYVIVGWFIGVLMASVSFLVLISNTFRSAVLASDALSGWSVFDDIGPSLYIGVLYFLLFPLIVKQWKGRSSVDRKKGGGSL
jgi:hypothetical protein